MYTLTNVAIKYWQSNRSIIPPWPGITSPKSCNNRTVVFTYFMVTKTFILHLNLITTQRTLCIKDVLLSQSVNFISDFQGQNLLYVLVDIKVKLTSHNIMWPQKGLTLELAGFNSTAVNFLKHKCIFLDNFETHCCSQWI